MVVFKKIKTINISHNKRMLIVSFTKKWRFDSYKSIKQKIQKIMNTYENINYVKRYRKRLDVHEKHEGTPCT